MSQLRVSEPYKTQLFKLLLESCSERNMDPQKEALLCQLTELIAAISSLPECQTVSKKMYSNLVRRVKLLSPLFEDLKDSDEGDKLGDDVVKGLELLRLALGSALELLKSVHEGSKIFQVSLFTVFSLFFYKFLV